MNLDEYEPALEESGLTEVMIEAGEEVLKRACGGADIPYPYTIITAAKDVYLAMEAARKAPV